MPNCKASSYYFQCVVYSENVLKKLQEHFICYLSPTHNKDAKPLITYCGTVPQYTGNRKHWHVLIRSPNQKTYNSFMADICQVFENDLNDIKFHEEDSVVKHPDKVIRYYYHIDYLKKEHFQIDINQDIPGEFIPYFVKGFSFEIQSELFDAIRLGYITCPEDIISNKILGYWYSLGNHAYICHSLFTETMNIELLRRKYVKC